MGWQRLRGGSWERKKSRLGGSRVGPAQGLFPHWPGSLCALTHTHTHLTTHRTQMHSTCNRHTHHIFYNYYTCISYATHKIACSLSTHIQTLHIPSTDAYHMPIDICATYPTATIHAYHMLHTKLHILSLFLSPPPILVVPFL